VHRKIFEEEHIVTTQTSRIPDPLSVELAYRRALISRDAGSARAAKRFRARNRIPNRVYGRHPSGGA
jgi:hypothetical protein